MKGIKLLVIVLSIICAMHVDASANDGIDKRNVEILSTLEIQPISQSQNIKIYQSSQAIAKRRKLSTTLRKPIVKKYKSKNHNLC